MCMLAAVGGAAVLLRLLPLLLLQKSALQQSSDLLLLPRIQRGRWLAIAAIRQHQLLHAAAATPAAALWQVAMPVLAVVLLRKQEMQADISGQKGRLC